MDSTPERKKISVLIPVLEPSEAFALVHEQAAAEIDKLGVDCEFLYLVSPESRALIDQIRELQRRDPERIGVIQVRHTVGGAAVLSAGIEEADGDVLLTLPPCFEVEFSVVPKLLAALEAGADLAIAGRSPREGTSGRIQSRMFNKLIAWVSGTNFTDITSDTRAIRREVLREVSLYADFHRYLPVLAERVGFTVQEVPAREHPDAPLVVYRPIDYLWRALDVLSIFFLSRFTRRPLRLFGSVGGLFAGVGGLILAVVAVQRLAFKVPLADRPILVLSALLFGLGVQLFTIGLLGELILFFQARNIRDYRIASVFEADEPTIPEKTSSNS